MEVKRLDLGADVVVLPQRDLMVIHPSLSYAEALGAVMGTLPDLHPDVAQALVEQVTPRPEPPPRRWPLIGLRMSLAAIVAAAMAWMVGPTPAVAVAEFGPNWQAAITSLGLDCAPTAEPDRRMCRDRLGHRFTMRGLRHDTGSLYLSDGPLGRVIFVFDEAADADRYMGLHPSATQYGRAVVW